MEQLSIVINDMEDVTKAIDQAQRKACTSIVEIGYVLRKADDAELFRKKDIAVSSNLPSRSTAGIKLRHQDLWQSTGNTARAGILPC